MQGHPRSEPVRHRRALLAAVLVACGALRLAWIAAVDVDPRRDFHFDMTFYDLAALRLVDGHLLRDFDGMATAKWSPGYPVLLAAAYALFGTQLLTAKLLNVALAVATCLGVHALAARLYGDRVALAAAAIFAVFPGDVFYAPLTLSETAFSAAFVGLLWLFAVWSERGRGGAAATASGGGAGMTPLASFAFGAAVGVATLVRGTAGLFLAVPAVVWWRESRSLRGTAARALVAALGMVAAIAPWSVRNTLALGAPVLVSTQQVGMALTFAHSEIADGGYSRRLIRYREVLLADLRGLPNPEREVAEYRTEVRRAFHYVLENPGRELALVPRRLFHLYRHDHAGMEWVRRTPIGAEEPEGFAIGPAWDPVLARVADVFFYAVLALGLLGAARAFASRRPTAWLLPLSVAYVTLLHTTLFAGDPRFHAPLAPVLSILAAGALLRTPPRAQRSAEGAERRSSPAETA